METFSAKEYLSLKMPTEEVAVSDHKRIEPALHTLGYGQVTFPLSVLRKLYPLYREAKVLAENMYCVQFASIPDFLVRMQAAKFIPHTDMGRFPSVRV